jgi:hypothetical protein
MYFLVWAHILYILLPPFQILDVLFIYILLCNYYICMSNSIQMHTNMCMNPKQLERSIIWNEWSG